MESVRCTGVTANRAHAGIHLHISVTAVSGCHSCPSNTRRMTQPMQMASWEGA